MNFTVVWLPAALAALTEVWMNATDRNAVTAASYRLEQRLAADPLNEGESRDHGDRITFESPLQIIFRVSPQDRIVYVYSLAPFVRRR